MNAAELKTAIEQGRYWSECHGPHCSNTIRHTHIDSHDEDGEYLEKPSQVLVSKHIDDAVFCSGKCRREAESDLRRLEKRRRRIIAKAFQLFGRQMVVKYCRPESRNGFCKCDLVRMRTEYPGSISLSIPRVLQYCFCGCVFCGQWDVPKIDRETWRAFLDSRIEYSPVGPSED